MTQLRGAHFVSPEGQPHSSAQCPLCHRPLVFFTGIYGQLLERCDTVACENWTPHQPQPISPLLPVSVKKNRKNPAMVREATLAALNAMVDAAKR